MNKEKKQKQEIREKEQLFAIPTKDGEELRFSVFKYQDKWWPDIRYFAEFGDVTGLRATKQGVAIHPARWVDFVQGVEKLTARLEKN